MRRRVTGSPGLPLDIVSSDSLRCARLLLDMVSSIAPGEIAMTPQTDALDVTRLLSMIATGWNAASGAMLAKPFADEADFINIMGLHGRGREVIARGHDEILSTVFRGTRMTAVVDSVRFLRPDVAAVEATLSLQGADGQPFTFA